MKPRLSFLLFCLGFLLNHVPIHGTVLLETFDFNSFHFDSPGSKAEATLTVDESSTFDPFAAEFNAANNVENDTLDSLDSSYEDGNHRRRLSNKIDFTTDEKTSTVNGVVPQITCEMGYYRPQGSTNLLRVTGQRVEGCRPCPIGRYGSVTGLISPICSAPCPIGKYGVREGSISAMDCEFCPAGRYGSITGLTSPACTAACPAGKYSHAVGMVQASGCLPCEPGMMTEQCQWAVQPRFSIDIDHQHNEVYGLKKGFTDPIPPKSSKSR